LNWKIALTKKKIKRIRVKLKKKLIEGCIWKRKNKTFNKKAKEKTLKNKKIRIKIKYKTFKKL
jgi:hypothetical protein